jgi:hypothetical protein
MLRSSSEVDLDSYSGKVHLRLLTNTPALAREQRNSRGVVAMIDSMSHLRHTYQTRCGAKYEGRSPRSLMNDDQQHCQRQLVNRLLGQRWVGSCHAQVWSREERG